MPTECCAATLRYLRDLNEDDAFESWDLDKLEQMQEKHP